MAGTAALFADWAEGFAQRKNQLPKFDPAVAAAAHGDPNILYFHGYWELAPDEALRDRRDAAALRVLELPAQQPLDGVARLPLPPDRAEPCAGAQPRPDGSVRLVVAHQDPGVPNWIETAGHRRGTMCLRWVGAQRHPEPTTRVVELEGPAFHFVTSVTLLSQRVAEITHSRPRPLRSAAGQRSSNWQEVVAAPALCRQLRPSRSEGGPWFRTPGVRRKVLHGHHASEISRLDRARRGPGRSRLGPDDRCLLPWLVQPNGLHTAANLNTLVGQGSSTVRFRSFFVFDLATLTHPAGAGVLRLELEAYLGPDPMEYVALYDVEYPLRRAGPRPDRPHRHL